ncbi:Regulator of SigK OS=Streptomyces microflavus OX=1919 GN=Smic_12580 PE=4 SV=1 [Streptomyces microflavus]
MTTADLHTLTGAYALHALPEDERREFERHLGDCEACTQEVRELSATAARLGLAVAETPPRELRERVLREITTVRQEPPAHGRRGRTVGNGRTGRWSTYALAACIAAAAAFGGVAVWQNQVAQDARQEANQATRQNDSWPRCSPRPNAKTTSGELTGGARGTVVVSQGQNRAVFLASGMERPPSGKVYQLWFNDEGDHAFGRPDEPGGER